MNFTNLRRKLRMLDKGWFECSMKRVKYDINELPPWLRSDEMSNSNYLAGVRFERQIMDEYRKYGFSFVGRTAGSHGSFDVIVVSPEGTVGFIQCKVTDSETTANRLIKQFKANPPLKSGHYDQAIFCKIKGTSKVLKGFVQ
jgi:hypothetical protein